MEFWKGNDNDKRKRNDIDEGMISIMKNGNYIDEGKRKWYW